MRVVDEERIGPALQRVREPVLADVADEVVLERVVQRLGRMPMRQQLERHAAVQIDLRRAGADLHPLLRACRARGNGVRETRHLHHAQAAHRLRDQALVVAERRHVVPEAAQGFEKGLVADRLMRHSVDVNPCHARPARSQA